MPIYYVKTDSDNKFPDKDTTPVLEPADDLRAVNISTTSVQYFLRYWWMYAFKGDSSQEVTAPGNLPPLDNDYLQELIDQQGKQIEQQAKNIESLKTENKSLKSANELTQQGLMELSITCLHNYHRLAPRLALTQLQQVQQPQLVRQQVNLRR